MNLGNKELQELARIIKKVAGNIVEKLYVKILKLQPHQEF